MEGMKFLPLAAVALALPWLLAACGGPAEKAGEPAPPVVRGPAAGAQPPPTQDPRRVIAAFGDSLTAGFGVEPGHTYPDYLQRLLDEKGYSYRIVNAGISGDTTAGGLARIREITGLKPEIVLLELGGNDGLRGLPVTQTKANLEEMVVLLQKDGITVVLAGMTLPRNYGPDYIKAFEQLYRDISARYKLVLIPFALETIAAEPGLMQRDGIHPTAEGYARAAPVMFGHLEKVLKK